MVRRRRSVHVEGDRSRDRRRLPPDGGPHGAGEEHADAPAPNQDEAIYVLEGELLVDVDGEQHRVGRRPFFAPRGVPHAFMVMSEPRACWGCRRPARARPSTATRATRSTRTDASWPPDWARLREVAERSRASNCLARRRSMRRCRRDLTIRLADRSRSGDRDAAGAGALGLGEGFHRALQHVGRGLGGHRRPRQPRPSRRPRGPSRRSR